MNIQLQLSKSLLQGSALRRVMKAMVQSQRSFTFKGTQPTSLSEQKIRSICTLSNTPPIYTIKVWAGTDLLTPGLLDPLVFNVVVKGSQMTLEDRLGGGRSAVVVEQIEQIESVFRMSLFELQKRCRLEALERASHLKYQEQHSCSHLKAMAEELCSRDRIKSMKTLSKYMKFYIERRQTTTKKCFTLWLILHFEGSLECMNRQIAEGQYLSGSSRSSLLRKCFEGWKCLAGL